jgi:PliI/PliC-like inhibitor of I-type lysozyme
VKYGQILPSSLLLISGLLQAQQAPTEVFEQQLLISSELMAVVSESPLEPRSIGSYTVKIYTVDSPEHPFDRFLAGIVRPRDGTVETLKTVDLNLDGDKELVVIIRSAGSGAYLSVDAYDISRDGLEFILGTSGLASDANPVSALTEKMRQLAQ